MIGPKPNRVVLGIACFGLFASLRHDQAQGAAIYGLMVGSYLPWVFAWVASKVDR